MNDCVQDVIDRLEPVIEKQGAKITKTIAPEDLTLLADRFYWTQIMFNLVENALKQNAAPGLEIEVEAKRVDGMIHLSVCDNVCWHPFCRFALYFQAVLPS